MVLLELFGVTGAKQRLDRFEPVEIGGERQRLGAILVAGAIGGGLISSAHDVAEG